MSEAQKCPKCGAIIADENATFCRKCKHPLRGAKSRWMVPD